MLAQPDTQPVIKPPRLQPGDRVKFVSPASTPSPEGVEKCVAILEGWGLCVELGRHIYDQHGYLAGTDTDRAADINEALEDQNIRAIFSTTGGKGAYRIADKLNFKAALGDPKPIIGFSEITILHLALLAHCNIAGIHGPLVSW